MYVCMYVCVYVCAYVRMYVCVSVCVCACVCVCVRHDRKGANASVPSDKSRPLPPGYLPSRLSPPSSDCQRSQLRQFLAVSNFRCRPGLSQTYVFIYHENTIPVGRSWVVSTPRLPDGNRRVLPTISEKELRSLISRRSIRKRPQHP